MLLIRRARIWTMTGAVYDPGYLWIDPPLIRALGGGEPPQDLLSVHKGPILDAGGSWLLPGLIDAHCHVGLFNDGLPPESGDGNEETDPLTPHLLAVDGLFLDDRCFTEAAAQGVTSVMTGPGSANVLGGQFALVHTAGHRVAERIFVDRAAMKAALGENPKKTHGARNRSPMTRMATAAMLRDALDQACHDKNRRAAAGTPAPAGARPDSPAPDARWQSLLPVLSGDMILKIHVHRSDDILTAVRLAEAYGLRYTLEHCSEGYRVVDELARVYTCGRASEHGCGLAGQGRLEGVIVGPLLSDRSKPELARSDLGNAAVLAAAGIPLAIMTDHPVVPLSFVTLNAAAAVRGGLPEDKALAGITSAAAQLCGCADLVGSLEPGKWADLALFSGHPFDYRSHCRLTFIQGRLVYRDEREADWEEI